jgi:hypothetical protein
MKIKLLNIFDKNQLNIKVIQSWNIAIHYTSNSMKSNDYQLNKFTPYSFMRKFKNSMRIKSPKYRIEIEKIIVKNIPPDVKDFSGRAQKE